MIFAIKLKKWCGGVMPLLFALVFLCVLFCHCR